MPSGVAEMIFSSLEGARYFVTFIDEALVCVTDVEIKTKVRVAGLLRHRVQWVELKWGHRLRKWFLAVIRGIYESRRTFMQMGSRSFSPKGTVCEGPVVLNR